jgi:hypothetical protein
MKYLFTSLIEFLRRSKKTVLLILVVAAITIALSTTISMFLSRINHLRIPSLGTIHTFRVEAYGGNITLKDGIQYVDWGTVYPGTLINRSLYLQSKSNIEAIFILEAANWTCRDSNDNIVTDPINNYMNLTWDYTATQISPGEAIYVTLTLQASPDESFINYLITNNVTSFSFEIVIYASEE